MSKSRGWGGKRPNSGAPKGNINAVKHGRYSKQLLELLEQVPEGFMVLNKKEKRLTFLYKKSDLEKLKRGGLKV